MMSMSQPKYFESAIVVGIILIGVVVNVDFVWGTVIVFLVLG